MSAQSYEGALNALYRGLGLDVRVRYMGSHYAAFESLPGGRVSVAALSPANVVREIDAIRADMEPCSECDGDGRVSVAVDGGWTGYVTCQVCAGFGAIPKWDGP